MSKTQIRASQVYDIASNLASDPSKTEQILKDCNWRDASFPPQLNQAQDQIVERPSFWQSLLSTDLALRASGTEYRQDTKQFFGTAPDSEYPLKGISSLDQTELQEHNKPLSTLPLLIVSVAERPDPPRPNTTVHNEWAIKTRNYEDLAKLSTRSQLVPISGTGHNMQLDVPDKTAALILAFIGHLK